MTRNEQYRIPYLNFKLWFGGYEFLADPYSLHIHTAFILDSDQVSDGK